MNRRNLILKIQLQFKFSLNSDKLRIIYTTTMNCMRFKVKPKKNSIKDYFLIDRKYFTNPTHPTILTFTLPRIPKNQRDFDLRCHTTSLFKDYDYNPLKDTSMKSFLIKKMVRRRLVNQHLVGIPMS